MNMDSWSSSNNSPPPPMHRNWSDLTEPLLISTFQHLPSMDSSSSSSNNSRNWSDLIEPLLISIFQHLPSIPDLISASAVSRHWRSAAIAASSSTHLFPPLLFNPNNPHFRTITHNSTKLYPSPLSSSHLPYFNKYCHNIRCIGFSNSNLIFTIRHHAFLLNVFTGTKLIAPNLNSTTCCCYSALLTAPLSSSSSLLVIAAQKTAIDSPNLLGCRILCWSLSSGSENWSVLDIDTYSLIVSLVLFKGNVYGVDSLCRLIVFELGGGQTHNMIGWRWLSGVVNLACVGIFLLVECDGELLLVLMSPFHELPRIEVYWFDFMESVWVKKEKLGDWCLFVDFVGKTGFSCKNPIRCGRGGNCVYVAGIDNCNEWIVCSLDGEAVDSSDGDYRHIAEWPSSLWVYPQMPR